MKVARWGNSLAVRLPRGVVDKLGLEEGDEIEILAGEGGSLTIGRDRRRDEALARIMAARRPLPPGFTFDRDEVYDSARNGFKPDPDRADDG